MNRKIVDIETNITQKIMDFCESRVFATKNIKLEIFWHKLGCWFLSHRIFK